MQNAKFPKFILGVIGIIGDMGIIGTTKRGRDVQNKEAESGA